MADRLVSEETLAAGQDKESRAQSKVIMKNMIMMMTKMMMMVMMKTKRMITMAYQHIPTSHIPTWWECVTMMKGGNMTQSHSHGVGPPSINPSSVHQYPLVYSIPLNILLATSGVFVFVFV